MDSKKEQIKTYIQEELITADENYEVSFNDDLLGNGLIDSMGIMKLVNFIEKSFEMEIPPEDIIIEHFMNIEAIVKYVEK